MNQNNGYEPNEGIIAISKYVKDVRFRLYNSLLKRFNYLIEYTWHLSTCIQSTVTLIYFLKMAGNKNDKIILMHVWPVYSAHGKCLFLLRLLSMKGNICNYIFLCAFILRILNTGFFFGNLKKMHPYKWKQKETSTAVILYIAFIRDRAQWKSGSYV